MRPLTLKETDSDLVQTTHFGDVYAGTFEMDIDGLWKFYPAIRSGYWTEGYLRAVADKLEECNAKHDAEINAFFAKEARKAQHQTEGRRDQDPSAVRNIFAGDGSALPGGAGQRDIRPSLREELNVQSVSDNSPTFWNIFRAWFFRGEKK